MDSIIVSFERYHTSFLIHFVLCLISHCTEVSCQIPIKKQMFVLSQNREIYLRFLIIEGWSGGAMVLGKLPMPGRPTNLDCSRARACCTCSRCGWGLFGHFSLVYHFSFLSPSLWEAARYRLKYCLKEPLSPKQPTI